MLYFFQVCAIVMYTVKRKQHTTCKCLFFVIEKKSESFFSFLFVAYSILSMDHFHRHFFKAVLGKIKKKAFRNLEPIMFGNGLSTASQNLGLCNVQHKCLSIHRYRIGRFSSFVTGVSFSERDFFPAKSEVEGLCALSSA